MTSNDPFAPPPDQPGSGSQPPALPSQYPAYQPPNHQPDYQQPSYPPSSNPYGQPSAYPQQPGYPQPGYPTSGYGYPAPPPAYGYGYPAPQRGHGKAIAGLVLGIVAVALCWLPIIGIPLWVLALIFSILGRSDARKGAGGRGLATAGLILAIVAAVANIVLTIVIFTIGFSSEHSCADQYGRGTSQYQACIDNQ